MEGVYVQTTLYEKDLQKIVETGELRGHGPAAIGKQILSVENVPLSYCSYVCEGYPMIYGNRQGVAFEIDEKPVYACPSDVFELMRGGTYLPGHERFLFESVEEMLEKYPTEEEFKTDFRSFFQKLVDEKYYPNGNSKFGKPVEWTDYCLFASWKTGYNEVTFRKPTKIKNVRIFQNQEELWEMIRLKKLLQK